MMKYRSAVVTGVVVLGVVSLGVLHGQQKNRSTASQGGGTGSARQGGAAITGTRKVDVMDPEEGMRAFTMDVPAGWKFAGAAAHPSGCHASFPGLKFTAQAPDGLTAIEQLPSMQWDYTTSLFTQGFMLKQGCAAVDVKTAADFLVGIAVPNLHPGARVVGVESMGDDVKADLAAQIEKRNEMVRSMGWQQNGMTAPKVMMDGARVRVQYERNGRPVEEWLSSIVECTENRRAAMFGQPAEMTRKCTSRGTNIVRAPMGQLDGLVSSPQYNAILHSPKGDPQWVAKVTQESQDRFNQQQAASAAQFQQVMQSGRDAHNALMRNAQAFNAQQQSNYASERRGFQAQQAAKTQANANFEAGQEAKGEAAHKFNNYVLDREDFVNPATGQTIEASSQYNHQWMSSDGSTLIQTDDHSYDPNGQVYPVNQSWTELVPK